MVERSGTKQNIAMCTLYYMSQMRTSAQIKPSIGYRMWDSTIQDIKLLKQAAIEAQMRTLRDWTHHFPYLQNLNTIACSTLKNCVCDPFCISGTSMPDPETRIRISCTLPNHIQAKLLEYPNRY